MVASTVAGVVGTRPVRGGVFGLLAGSVVAGYWQLDPSVAGGLNGGSGASDVGEPAVLQVRPGRNAEPRRHLHREDGEHDHGYDDEHGQHRQQVTDDQARDRQPAAVLAGAP